MRAPHSPAPRQPRLGLAAALLPGLAMLRPAAAADEAQAPLKAQLERIDALRAQRPGDGLLADYRAMTLAALHRRDDALVSTSALAARSAGDTPLVIANSHVAQLQPGGTLRDPSALRPTRIVSMPLRRAVLDRGRAAAPRNGSRMARQDPPNWPLRPAGPL